MNVLRGFEALICVQVAIDVQAGVDQVRYEQILLRIVIAVHRQVQRIGRIFNRAHRVEVWIRWIEDLAVLEYLDQSDGTGIDV